MKIVLITAIWCPSCIIMRPRYLDKIKEYKLELKEYDFDDDEDVIKEYNIGSTLPIAIIINNDKEILRIIGEKSKKELDNLFNGVINA